MQGNHAEHEDTPKMVKNKNKKTKKQNKKQKRHFDVQVYQEGVIWQFFQVSRHPREDSLFLSVVGFSIFFFSLFLIFFSFFVDDVIMLL